MAAATVEAPPAPKNFFNFFSNYGGRPSVDRVNAWLLAIVEELVRLAQGSGHFRSSESLWIHPLI
jgi:hypothetical protein